MLVGAHDHDADTLSDAELISMLWGMLLGGFSTTAATIDHAVLAMLGYPEQRHWLQGDAVGVKALVEEVLRRDSPVMFSTTMRIARRDIELGGVVIPKNTDVPVLIAAGNRDPDAFADPDRFDPARFYGTSPGMSTDGKIMLSFGTASAAASVRNWPGCSWPRACRGSRRASPRWHWLSRRPGSPPSSLGRSARCRCCCMRRGAEMRVVIDQDLCATSGQCVLTLPGNFRQREPDGVAEVCVATVPQAPHAAVRLAANQCPVAAIRVIESDVGDDERASADPAPSPAEAERHAAKDQRNPGGHDGGLKARWPW
ncbi:ferredoxin [Bradyrhizobium sp. LA2.1]